MALIYFKKLKEVLFFQVAGHCISHFCIFIKKHRTMMGQGRLIKLVQSKNLYVNVLVIGLSQHIALGGMEDE